MALSPFKNPENSPNRSRSSSCSSPLRNRIVFQQFYSVGSNTLVRSYSCDQVFDSSSGKTFQTTQIQVASFLTPDKNTNIRKSGYKLKEPKRLCFPAEKPREFPSPVSEEPPPRKRKDKPKAESVRVQSFSRIMFAFAGLAVLPAVAFYLFYSYKECSYVWNLEKTKSELESSIFGQNKAVNQINQALALAVQDKNLNILVFTGGVGIGKTFTSSIISNNFPWSFNKLISHSESNLVDINELHKYNFLPCGMNLITVEDLSLQSAENAVRLLSVINNKRQHRNNVLVILIFTVNSEGERNEVIESLKKSLYYFHHIPFKTLTKEDVENCYRTEMNRLKIYIPEAKLKKLVADKLEYVDVSKGPVGCKGVLEDVAFFYKEP